MGVTEYKVGNATVRIHPGKMTSEERRDVLMNSKISRDYYKAMLRADLKREKEAKANEERKAAHAGAKEVHPVETA